MESSQRTYYLIWAPDGKQIAVVQAHTPGAARRKAPQPYRKYLGEIRAEVEERVYPPRVWSRNTEKAQATGEAEEIDYECYLDARANKKVAYLLVGHAGAPGIGRVVHRITRMDDTGVYGVEIENTIRVMDGPY